LWHSQKFKKKLIFLLSGGITGDTNEDYKTTAVSAFDKAKKIS
jgi:hypothetical protein